MVELDYKKQYQDLYQPKNKPMLIKVPPINFIMMDGKGDPQGQEYQNAIAALYALSFTIKMSKMSGSQPEGYFEYVVPPLEGLWDCDDGQFSLERRDHWVWTSMIRQPEFVTAEVFRWACQEVCAKKPEVDVSRARFEIYDEGLCVQMMHIGPYADEPASIAQIAEFITKNQLRDMCGGTRQHHEIYVSDPRKTAPEKLKTVLRHPVERIKI